MKTTGIKLAFLASAIIFSLQVNAGNLLITPDGVNSAGAKNTVSSIVISNGGGDNIFNTYSDVNIVGQLNTISGDNKGKSGSVAVLIVGDANDITNNNASNNGGVANAAGTERETAVIGSANVINGGAVNVTGGRNTVNGDYTNINGSNNAITGSDSNVFGSKSTVNASNSVAIGNNSSNYRDNTVSVGSSGNERQITNVAAGTADTDGANIKQMRDGDTATLNSAMAYTDTRETAINNRTDALLANEQSERLAGDATTLSRANTFTHNREMAINSRTDGLVASEKSERVAGDALTLSSANTYTDRKETAINSRTDRLIGNEQSARIDGDKKTLESANNYTSQKFSQLNDRVNRNERRANAGISGAMAMTSIPYLNYVDNSVGMGTGTYRGETSIAAGYQRQINSMTNFRISTSWDTSNGVGLAAGMALGW